MKNILKKLINNKHVSYWLWLFVTLALPVLIIGHRYDLTSRPWWVQISIPTLIALIWALVRFWSEIAEAASTIKEGMGREIAVSIVKIGPYLLLYLIGFFLELFYQDYMYIVTVLLLTQVGGVILQANYKRLKRVELIGRGYVNVLSE